MSTSIQTGRRNARVKALQALYQWDMNTTAGNDPQPSAIEAQFHDSQDMRKVDLDYFHELFDAASTQTEELDRHMAVGIDRSVEDLDPIERSVLRLGVYELTSRLEIPLKVVINEWVEITKRFGADKGHKFVNGVMDKLGQNIRSVESSAIKKEG